MGKNSLLIIDPQIDFHPEGGHGDLYHPPGSLAVPGANEDSQRTADFIRDHINDLDDIFVTLDSHHKNHIAHGITWEDSHGNAPPPFTQISNMDIKDGKWRPRDHSMLPYALSYTEKLENNGRFKLIIWPEHCLIGSVGHAVVPCIHAALQEWSARRHRNITYVLKGQNNMTEMYSAIAADVIIPEDSATQKNPLLMKDILSADHIYICGQALSHCVAFTTRDILNDLPASQASKLVLLVDASSPVPGFKQQADDFIHEMVMAGVQMSSTTDPLK